MNWKTILSVCFSFILEVVFASSFVSLFTMETVSMNSPFEVKGCPLTSPSGFQVAGL